VKSKWCFWCRWMGSSILIWNDRKITHGILFCFVLIVKLDCQTSSSVSSFCSKYFLNIRPSSRIPRKYIPNAFLVSFRLTIFSWVVRDDLVLLLERPINSCGFNFAAGFYKMLDQNHILTSQGYWVTQSELMSTIHLQSHVYYSTIHNSQVMETAKMPHYWRMD
jgi:hypothetical protein